MSKMEEEIEEWGHGGELDVFSLPYGQGEDILGESQAYGST